MSTAQQEQKAYKGWGMEGPLARWYARNTGKRMEPFKKEAQEIAHEVPSGAAVLEVAPGPGYLAIELARLGSYRIVGLDVSKSFVRIATENAAKVGVQVTFREGNASWMPFESESFDFVCCRAAFKNFSEPVKAIQEMYRVLKSGGKAVIHDLRKDASLEDIREAVQEMGLGWAQFAADQTDLTVAPQAGPFAGRPPANGWQNTLPYLRDQMQPDWSGCCSSQVRVNFRRT